MYEKVEYQEERRLEHAILQACSLAMTPSRPLLAKPPKKKSETNVKVTFNFPCIKPKSAAWLSIPDSLVPAKIQSLVFYSKSNCSQPVPVWHAG